MFVCLFVVAVVVVVVAVVVVAVVVVVVCCCFTSLSMRLSWWHTCPRSWPSGTKLAFIWLRASITIASPFRGVFVKQRKDSCIQIHRNLDKQQYTSSQQEHP